MFIDNKIKPLFMRSDSRIPHFDVRGMTRGLYKMFFENANDGIIFLDTQAVIRASNKRVEDLFGYREEEIIGKQFTDIPVFDPINMKATYTLFIDTLAGKLPPLLTFEGIRKNGTRFSLEINPTLVKDRDELVGLIVILRDISLRKRMENERERLIDIIEATPDLVITYDSCQKILYANRAARKIFRINDLNGLTISDLFSGIVSLPVQPGSGIKAGECRIPLENDASIQVSLVAMEHLNEDSEHSFFSVIMRDISEQKQKEDHITYLTHHLIKILENERLRISRDLHDNLAQDLSSLKILCETLFIRKHADADHIKVNLTASHPTVILQIKDNGKGFELNKRKKELIYEKRMGLKIIEERIGLINGTYKIQSKPSVGTLVHLEIPHIQN